MKTVVARRRSGRLSASKDTIFAASKSVAQGDVQKSKQPANPSRGRSKSASSKGTTEPNAIDKQKEEVPEKHTRKRSRSVKATHPPAYLAVAGRNSNGANQKPAAKRVRSGSIDIGGRDGLPQEHHNLALAHFEANKYTIGISHYDRPNQGNVFQTPEYVSDIFQRLYHSEVSMHPTWLFRCYVLALAQSFIPTLRRAMLPVATFTTTKKSLHPCELS